MQMPVTLKRSSKLAWTTMVAVGSAFALAACGGGDGAPAANAAAKDKKVEVQVFDNVIACAEDAGRTREQCESMRNEALTHASNEAPRFEALHDCESQYGPGQCVENGFGEARGLDRHEVRLEPRSYSPFVNAWFSYASSNTPLFKSKDGGYQTANGTRLAATEVQGRYYASNRALERVTVLPEVKPASRVSTKRDAGRRNGTWKLSDRSGGSSILPARAASSAAAQGS